MRVGRRIKAFIDGLGGNPVELTREGFRDSENLLFILEVKICIVKRG